MLKHIAILLLDQDDELKYSKNKSTRVFIEKLGYVARIEEEVSKEMVWWWKLVWKLEIPLKTIIFLWLNLVNNILTRDNGPKKKLKWP
jgi:hypothetical protein